MAELKCLKRYKFFISHAVGYDKIDVFTYYTLDELMDLASAGTFLSLPTKSDGSGHIGVRAANVVRIIPMSQ